MTAFVVVLLQVLNIAKYEKEIRKYKEKMNETEFYKSRVEVRGLQLTLTETLNTHTFSSIL